MDVELAKELYFKEMEAKTQLDSRLGIYAVLLSAVGGIVAFLIRTAWPVDSLLSLGGLFASFASVVIYGFALIWVFRATLGYTYERVPYSSTILNHWKSLSTYYWRNPSVVGTASQDFEEFLIEQFSLAATKNASNNMRRSARFYGAGQLLLWVIVLAAVSGIAQGMSLLLPLFNSKGP